MEELLFNGVGGVFDCGDGLAFSADWKMLSRMSSMGVILDFSGDFLGSEEPRLIKPWVRMRDTFADSLGAAAADDDVALGVEADGDAAGNLQDGFLNFLTEAAKRSDAGSISERGPLSLAALRFSDSFKELRRMI